MFKNFILLVVFSLTLNAVKVFAQDKGDEDKAMYNANKSGDAVLIEAAKNQWWNATTKTHDERLKWWKEAKFGMFIHWGIYSMPAGEWKGKVIVGYSEHLMRKEKIPRAEYLDLAHQFNPTKFNADAWVKAAKSAGMNYLIITAKHHDGFAMYDSKVSDFNIVQQTAWKHDPMVDLSAACKKYGVHFGFYYSHAFDWEHPDAPGNDWDYKNPGGDLGLFGGRTWYDQHPEILVRAQKYVDEKAIPQIKELLTKYHPEILWFDTPQKLPLSENIKILKAIRETDKNVVVNGRLVRGASQTLGDYTNTGDRPAEFFPVAVQDWEAIPTTNNSYGYSKFDSSHQSIPYFVQLVSKAASRNGNILLNVGPKGDGSMDVKDLKILDGLGKWTSKNKDAIYNTIATPLPLQSFGVTTMKDNKLYLHVFNWPSDGKLAVAGLQTKISKAYLLTDITKSKLKYETYGKSDMLIHLPAIMPDTNNTVIVLELQDKIAAVRNSLIVPTMPNRFLAFDATLNGKFSHGDGKIAAYYVDGWKKVEQTIGWKMHTNESGTYKVTIKYAVNADCGGSYQVKIGNTPLVGNINETYKKGEIMTKELGQVKLESGQVNIEIVPIKIDKKELMKLFEIQLIPIK